MVEQRRPQFCTRCRGPLIEVDEPGDFNAYSGDVRCTRKIKCARFARPWWRRLGRPATYHDSYLVLESDVGVTYHLADWL